MTGVFRIWTIHIVLPALSFSRDGLLLADSSWLTQSNTHAHTHCWMPPRVLMQCSFQIAPMVSATVRECVCSASLGCCPPRCRQLSSYQLNCWMALYRSTSLPPLQNWVWGRVTCVVVLLEAAGLRGCLVQRSLLSHLIPEISPWTPYIFILIESHCYFMLIHRTSAFCTGVSSVRF